MNIKIFILCFGLLFYFFSCHSLNKNNQDKYDRFDDQYNNFKYINNSLRLTVEFDGDWLIIPKYSNFNDFQKMYSKYFSSDYSEVLFIGFNDVKKIGARCTCESLGLKDEEYYENLNFLFTKLKDYKITVIENKEISLPNIKGIHLILETYLNDNNIFIFDSIIFSDKSYNFKFDMWTEKEEYENKKDYILNVFKTIDFLPQTNNSKDNTADTIKNDK